MGTNFYLTDPEDVETSEELYLQSHIGKRSAAGLYCISCDVTLCKYGPEGVHYGSLADHDLRWHKVCPQCGAAPVKEPLSESTAGLELGFAKPRTAADRTGVRTVSSFSWGIAPDVLLSMQDDTMIWSEYGDTMTLAQFKDEVLANCPASLWYRQSIGQWFS